MEDPQSKRLDLYKEHAATLLDHDHAYRCFCTPERLSLVRLEAQKAGRTASYDRKCAMLSKQESQNRADKGEPFVIRMKVRLTPALIAILVPCNRQSPDLNFTR